MYNNNSILVDIIHHEQIKSHKFPSQIEKENFS